MSDVAQDEIDQLDDPFDFEPDEEPEAAAIPLTDKPPYRIPRGKYKGFALPRMIGVKPSYYEKVRALQQEIVADPEFQRYASTISRTYADLRREAEEKAKEYAEVKLRLAAVMLLMVDQFEAEDESAVTLGNGDKIAVHSEPHLIVTDKEKFRQWCVKQDLQQSMVLPWGTANKMMKELLMSGYGEVPGAECFARPKVTFTKGDK